MKHFKNKENKIFAYDEDQLKDKKIKAIVEKLTEIDMDEVKELTAPSDEDLKLQRLSELKNLLNYSDRKMTGDYQKRTGKSDEYMAQVITDRDSWYKEIKDIELELAL